MEQGISGKIETAGFLGQGFDVELTDCENEIFAYQGRRWSAVGAEIRGAFRLARIGLHLLWGMATVALTFPFLPVKLQRGLKARWSRQLLDVVGVHLRFSGTPPKNAMVVANHVSWLDVYAINAMAPMAFVAKDDVRDWPLIGWLSSRTETLFIERGSRSAAMRIKDRLTEQLRQGANVALFPEGTTSAGVTVLPFHSALFQSSIDADTCIAPIAVCYTTSNGERATAPIYIGETSLWQSLRAIVRADGITANLSFLPTIDPDGMDRRQIAEDSRRMILGILTRTVGEAALDA
jgi:1-acyl-sn-glycerol-3-phosphate acyltransferase